MFPWCVRTGAVLLSRSDIVRRVAHYPRRVLLHASKFYPASLSSRPAPAPRVGAGSHGPRGASPRPS